MFKVLVIDDTAFMRQYLKKAIETQPDIEVIVAPNGAIGIEKFKIYNPDVVTLDYEMPGMNGIECLKEILKIKYVPVIMVSSFTEEGTRVTIDALSLGAFDFVSKGKSADKDFNEDFNEILLEKIDAAIQYKVRGSKEEITRTFSVKHVEKTVESVHIEKKDVSIRNEYSKIEVVGIGISTGGPSVVRQILSSLPKNFKYPILVVQHMPVGFTKEFAQRLNEICKIEVKEAEDGDIVKPGRALIAQGGKHLAVKKEQLATVAKVYDAEKVSGHKPSADVLFDSIAKEYGERALGVIMTGMGSDGSHGLLEMRKNGAITWGQNEGTCVVYGMPKAAAEIGAVMEVMSIDEVIQKLIQIGG